jgi:hypothetical protein
VAISAPQLMVSNAPARGDRDLLREHTIDGAAARCAHRRPATSTPRLPVHRRSEEGPDQDERLPVWPREIEEAIAAHPAVAEVGVAGISDPTQGET